ncbi:MAG TPA: SDR family oxidoreductase, partial [Acidimicrobiales bacterium]|nr:SDR family oxidoreductase [Acidimicrobiales bacterium]
LVDTDMVGDNPVIADRLADRIPVGRLGRAAEVADMVAAVVANGYVTGQTVSVDGGLHPR